MRVVRVNGPYHDSGKSTKKKRRTFKWNIQIATLVNLNKANTCVCIARPNAQGPENSRIQINARYILGWVPKARCWAHCRRSTFSRSQRWSLTMWSAPCFVTKQQKWAENWIEHIWSYRVVVLLHMKSTRDSRTSSGFGPINRRKPSKSSTA